MFRATFKNTLRNILRSPTFWIVFVFIVGLTFYNASRVSHGYLDLSTGQYLEDRDPGYVYSYSQFVSQFNNGVCAGTMFYALPLLVVAAVTVVLKRDYGDNFYEIEKAAGAKSGTYIAARFCALLLVGFVTDIFFSFFNFHMYTALRSMVSDMDFWTYISESTVGVMKMTVGVQFPATIFFVGLTYGIGALTHSSLAASITATVYDVAYFASSFFLRLKLMFEYGIDLFAWLPGYPHNVRSFFAAISRNELEKYIEKTENAVRDTVLSFGIILLVFVLSYVLSYIRQRKRTA